MTLKRLRILKSSMGELQAAYGLRNDPLYKDVDKEINNIAKGVRGALSHIKQLDK